MTSPRAGLWRRELRRTLGGALNVTAARLMNRRRGAPAGSPELDLAGYRALSEPTPRDLASLLAWRSNRERGRLTEAVLRDAGLPVDRRPYRTVEGAGVNLFVDLGAGPRTLVLAAHHDAVPGSPGANDNAAAVGILRALGACLLADPPRRLRVRLGIFGGEERAMLGSRVYVRRGTPEVIQDLLGVVSLELCGIGDSLALWDVTPALEATPLVRAWIATMEALGYRRDETYHLAEPVPFFGSDHRPFVDRGVPGAGLTAIPRASMEALRTFIYGGVRGILVQPARRPPPFTTYHTGLDAPETLELGTLGAVGQALEGFVRTLDAVPPKR